MANEGAGADSDVGAADAGPVGDDRARRALLWGVAFGVVGGLVLGALVLVSFTILGAMVKLTAEAVGAPVEDVNYGDLALDTSIGPLTCVAVSGAVAWLIARFLGTTVPPWALGLLSALVGVGAGYGILQLTVL